MTDTIRHGRGGEKEWGKNLLKKNLVKEILTSCFGASVVPSQRLYFLEEIPMNNFVMCDDQDGIKNGQKEHSSLGVGRSKTLEVKTS